MGRREGRQMIINRFKSLNEIDEIEKGTTIYQRNDQAKVHWEMTKFTVTGSSDTHLLCKDTEGAFAAFAFDELENLFIIKM